MHFPLSLMYYPNNIHGKNLSLLIGLEQCNFNVNTVLKKGDTVIFTELHFFGTGGLFHLYY